MVNRHNRLLATFHVLSDALLGVSAFIIAYALRFHTDLVTNLIPITRGVPPLRQYIQDLPFVAILVPLGFQLQGLYRLRRGRSRVDDEREWRAADRKRAGVAGSAVTGCGTDRRRT